MKKIIKAFVFLVILICLWNCFFDVLTPKITAIDEFYDEPKNSLDVVYIGSSNANSHFNSVLAYEKFGFTTGFMASESQHFSSILHLLKESRNYQMPELYVIDITRIKDMVSVAGLEKFNYFDVRKTIDAMKLNMNKINAIYDLKKYVNLSSNQYITYFLSHLIYHNTWKKIDNSYFMNGDEGWYRFYKGFQYVPNANEIRPQEENIWHSDRLELETNSYVMLIDLINYIIENDLKVEFVIPDIYHSDYDISIYNEVISIIESYRLNVINFNTEHDFELNHDVDFYEASHFNIFGSTKFTLYFADYLKEKYDLKDHRGDKKYKSWDEKFEEFKNTFETENDMKLETLITKKGK